MSSPTSTSTPLNPTPFAPLTHLLSLPHPPTPHKNTQTHTTEGEFVVPALLNLSATDPRWTEDEPQLFKPERMMTPEGQKRGWLMPFGYGPR